MGEKVIERISPQNILGQNRDSQNMSRNSGKSKIVNNPVMSDHKLKKISQFNHTQPISHHNKTSINKRVSEQKGIKGQSKITEKSSKSSFSLLHNHLPREIVRSPIFWDSSD